MSLKFYNTYYGLHYLQELLYNTTGTKTPGEQEVSVTTLTLVSFMVYDLELAEI